MHIEKPVDCRKLKTVTIQSDLTVVGGGLSGICCAITAARAGSKVTLVQDRPVLGGNASSEVRLWILGATSHMGNNNRWAREGGVINEIMVENLYRNPEGNPLVLDTILLEKVVDEPNITLLLNTSVHDLEKSSPDVIRSVRAFCSQNSTAYILESPLFVDASGDGVIGFLAGAAFRIGAEGRSEFGELFAPELPHRELLGHTIYFYSKDTGRPVKFHPPSFALKDINKIPRWRDIKVDDSGCRFWWLEWGGALDTIHDSELIKWELWKVVYGVWNHIKNSGLYPSAENLTLEWVGTIPGKRESRRFEGDVMVTQQDVVEQREVFDAVSFGGWAIDLHPVEGVYSPESPCTQWHSKGVYQIPYRAFYSRNIQNLFLAGRIISASHVAFGSTRVMATCADGGQAVGMAAAMCARDGLVPRDLLEARRMAELQRRLLRSGQFIPGVALKDPEDLCRTAKFVPSSVLALESFASNGHTQSLASSWAMMLPVSSGKVPALEVLVDVTAETTLTAELRVSSKVGNHTPDKILQTLQIPLKAGDEQKLSLVFDELIVTPQYAFFCLMQNDAVSVHLSDQRVTGVLALTHSQNKAVAKSATQSPPAGIGIDTFEFWTPKRRPAGNNFALRLAPPLSAFGVENLSNGIDRPLAQSNAWVAGYDDSEPELEIVWERAQSVGRIELAFDADFDHPLESVLMGHPERVSPFCVPAFQIIGENGEILAEVTENHHSLCVVNLPQAVTTRRLKLRMHAPSALVPAAVFAVRCFAS